MASSAHRATSALPTSTTQKMTAKNPRKGNTLETPAAVRISLPHNDYALFRGRPSLSVRLSSDGGRWPSENHRVSALKVSQACNRPSLKPLRNQRARCSDDPWVKESGTT